MQFFPAAVSAPRAAVKNIHNKLWKNGVRPEIPKIANIAKSLVKHNKSEFVQNVVGHKS